MSDLFLLSQFVLSANSGNPDSTRSVMQQRVLCEPWQSVKLGEGKILNFSLKPAGEESVVFEVLAIPVCVRAARRSLTTVQTAAAPLMCTTLKNCLCTETSKHFLLGWGSLSYLSGASGVTHSSESDWSASLTPLLGQTSVS